MTIITDYAELLKARLDQLPGVSYRLRTSNKGVVVRLTRLTDQETVDYDVQHHEIKFMANAAADAFMDAAREFATP